MEYSGPDSQRFHKIAMTLNIHHFTIKMLTGAFSAYTKVLRKYVGFYDACNRAFEDFLSVLNALSNDRVTYQVTE